MLAITLVFFVGLGLALIYLAMIAMDRPAEGHRLRSAAKTAATALLVATGLAAGAPGLILWGLALGALGDFQLSRPGTAAFVVGMAAFATGHVAYALALWARAQDLGFTTPGLGQVMALGLLAAIVLVLAVWLSSRAGPLRLPVFGYTLIIGAMAASAVILPQNTGDRLIQTGVALFLLSDTLLATRLFVAKSTATRRALGLAVWPTYWAGQALILFGATLYWSFPKG